MEDWKKHAIGVVTGSNKGIGFAIARGLGKAGVKTILTARNPDLGLEAQKKLKAEGIDVLFHRLDITDKDSIKAFSQWVEKEYGHLDILVNNAGVGVMGDQFGVSAAQQTNSVNYFGTRDVTLELLPLLKKSSIGARIVTVGSRLGQLNVVGPELQKKFADPKLTQQELDKMMESILSEIEGDTYEQSGWPTGQYNLYSASKVGVAAFSRILARDLKAEGTKIAVNVCCPGYVNTDMTSGQGHKTIDEGADTPVWLALQPQNGPSGGFYAERKEIGYGESTAASKEE